MPIAVLVPAAGSRETLSRDVSAATVSSLPQLGHGVPLADPPRSLWKEPNVSPQALHLKLIKGIRSHNL